MMVMNMKIKMPEEIEKKIRWTQPVLSQPTETISLDAQRYALEWVMCQHD